MKGLHIIVLIANNRGVMHMTFIKGIKKMALLPLLICSLATGAQAQPQGAGEVKPDPAPVTRQVILIVIDGLQADAVSAATTPNINGLGMAGVVAEKVSVMPPDNPEARFYSLLCGYDLAVGNTFSPESTLLAGMEKKGIKTVLIDGTGGFAKAAQGLSYQYPGPFKDDGEVVDRAVEMIKNKKPFLTVMVLAGPGREKALTGTGSKTYLEAVATADNEVGRFLRQLHIDGQYEESLLAVAGTTGSPPLIIKGKEFLAGGKLPPVCLKDLAPTIGYLYGIHLAGAKGLVVWNAFATGPDRSEGFVLQKRIKDLSQAYADLNDDAARLENEKIMVQEEKARLTRDKQSVEDQITQRDRRINELSLKMTIMKIAGMIGALLFFVALAVEYRILKKRYLFFT
jgi:hypothetical protein